MKETGIIMSGDHPRKILDGNKTMTRRVITPQPYWEDLIGAWNWVRGSYWQKTHCMGQFKDSEEATKFISKCCPYGGVGDRLWVRETWSLGDDLDGKEAIYYKATAPEGQYIWSPSIFMPRWASRILLEITELRAERLQEITEEDINAEGIILKGFTEDGSWVTPRYRFETVWNEINAKYPWQSNPWVWVIGWPRFSFENTQKE